MIYCALVSTLGAERTHRFAKQQWRAQFMDQMRTLAGKFSAAEIWLVAPAVGASVLYRSWLPIALAIMGFFWPVRWLASGRPGVPTCLDWALVCLMLTLPVTLWTTAWPETTVEQVFRLLVGIGLLYSVVNWAESQRRLMTIVRGLVLVGLLMAVLAPVSVRWKATGKLPFLPPILYEQFSTMLGDTIHANVLAGALVLVIPLAAALVIFDWVELAWPDRFLFGLGAMIMAGAVVLTQSRGGLIGLAVAMAVLVALRWQWGWLGPLVAAMGVLAVVRIWGLSIILDRSVVGVGEVEIPLDTLTYRYDTWTRAVQMIHDFPYTGIGMGNFQTVANLLYPSAAGISDVPHAHNIYLQVAADLGIPGLVAWLAMLMLVTGLAWSAFRGGRRRSTDLVCGLGAGLLSAQTALIVHGLTDAVVWGMVRTGVLVWGLWGLAMATYRFTSERDAAAVVAAVPAEQIQAAPLSKARDRG